MRAPQATRLLSTTLLVLACARCGSTTTAEDNPSPAAPVEEEAGPRTPTADPKPPSPDAAGPWTTIDVPGGPRVLVPKLAIEPREMAVIVNDADPASVALGKYYVEQRKIPAAQLVSITLPPGDALTPAQLTPLRDAVFAKLSGDVQALALAWTTPYRVGTMSIAAAFAFGYSQKDDLGTDVTATCRTLRPSPLFGADGADARSRPFTKLGVRPTMMLTARSPGGARALVDRGLSAESTLPKGTVYLNETTDAARTSPRAASFDGAATLFAPTSGVTVKVTDNRMGSAGDDPLRNRADVIGHETGLATIADITTNKFLPGSFADHLTSYGGVLAGDPGQTVILDWIEAGASGTYGTVIEPCNHPEKFPDPTWLLPLYFRGATMVQAYYAAVEMPGQGAFVGDPLTRSYGQQVRMEGADLVIETTGLEPKVTYAIDEADDEAGPFVQTGITKRVEKLDRVRIVVPAPTRRLYRLRPPK